MHATMRLLLIVILTGVSAAAGTPAQAQRHVAPPNGGDGVPGLFPHSFILEWEEVPGAVKYDTS